MRLIHLTDPHLTDPGPFRLSGRGFKRLLAWQAWHRRRRFRHRPERLADLVKAARAESPDHWLVTGDLCQFGLDHEIRAAREWLTGLAPPEQVTLVPGNHDIYAPDSAAPAREAWAPWLGPGPSPVVNACGGVRVIGLDSARPTATGLATGRLGPAQRERLATALAESANTFRVVGIHHPPLPGLTSRRRALDDAPQLAEILSRHGAELVLHGHLHRNSGKLPAAPGNPAIFCTASASDRDGPAYRRFDIEPDGGGTRVRMSLRTVDPDGSVQELERAEWHTDGSGEFASGAGV